MSEVTCTEEPLSLSQAAEQRPHSGIYTAVNNMLEHSSLQTCFCFCTHFSRHSCLVFMKPQHCYHINTKLLRVFQWQNRPTNYVIYSRGFMSRTLLPEATTASHQGNKGKYVKLEGNPINKPNMRLWGQSNRNRFTWLYSCLVTCFVRKVMATYEHWLNHHPLDPNAKYFKSERFGVWVALLCPPLCHSGNF